MADLDKNLVAAIIERLRVFLGCTNNSDLAEALNLTPQAISGWLRRGTLDFQKIISIPNISLDYIILGKKDDIKQSVTNTVKEPAAVYSGDNLEKENIILKAQLDLLRELLKEKEGELMRICAGSSGRQSSRAEHIQSNIHK